MAINVGLDIGTSAVRAAVLQTGKGLPELRAFSQVALPPGAVVGGEVIDEQIVTDAITQLWKQAKLPRKRVVVGIANQRVIVRRIDIPYMPEEELAEALPFQAQEYIPIPIEDAILDFVPLEEFTTPEGEPMLSVLVVAAHQDMATGVLRVVSGAGIKPMAVDLQAFAIVRAVFGAELDLETAPQSIVSIGAGITQVIIVRGGTVRFLRLIPTGGADFTDALVERLNMDPDAAEELKRRVGVAANGLVEGDDLESQARAVLTQTADQLIDEVRGSIDFFLSQSEGMESGRILVSGNGARLPHLANRLGRALNMSIEPIRVVSDERLVVGKVGLSEAELMQTEPVLPVPVGLALWGEV